jgi:hypothetical protein
MPTPIAIVISDLHLSLLRPACRADKDWLLIQADYLRQVRDTARDLGRLPVLCCGDVFDRWNPPPELINFALGHLPSGMLCVPGQHDLPNHRIEDMHRSGYGVLVRAGKIRDISGGKLHETENLVIRGFGWEEPVQPCRHIPKNKLHVVVLHRYLFVDEKTCYPGAPESGKLSGKLKEILGTYDAVFSGDNHKKWMSYA